MPNEDRETRTETHRSLMLIGAADPSEPFRIRKHLFPDAPPPADPDPNIIRFRDGRTLMRTVTPARTLREKFAAATFEEHGSVEIEPDRRLFRVQPQFNETRARSKVPWNLEAIGITGKKNQPTGKGAIVAVLDSGLDFTHPDFSRELRASARSFDGDPQDPDGHGTHCAGIIAARPRARSRYSVAPDAQLLISNVYEHGAQSSDWTLLVGLFQAAEQGAHVASISIGVLPTQDCPRHSMIFQIVAEYLLDEYGMVIIAAAGNESDRLDPVEPYIGPIVHPADCPAIIAVGAVDEQRRPARTSSGGVCTQRAPSLVAPGVGIDSAYLTSSAGANGPYYELSGTSQAAPHVAGAAALWIEKGYKGRDLFQKLLETAQPLNDGTDARFDVRHVGAGMVRVPE
jgi:subtilisin